MDLLYQRKPFSATHLKRTLIIITNPRVLDLLGKLLGMML